MAAMRLSVSSNRAGRGLEFLARFLNLSGSVEVAKVAGDATEFKSGADVLTQPASIAKALLGVATPPQTSMLGDSAAIKAQAGHWISQAMREDASGMLKAFDASLALSSFAAGPTFTVADAMMLHSLQADIAEAVRSGSIADFPNVVRWALVAEPTAKAAALDAAALPESLGITEPLLRPAESAKALAELLGNVPVAPVVAATAAPTAAKVAAPPAAPAAAAAAAASSAAPSTTPANTGKGGKGGKGDDAAAGKKAAKKEKKAKKPAAKAAAADVSPMAECDFRVGRITKCWVHPDADKLFCEDIDCGEASGDRQIASGLVGHYADPSELTGKLVLVAFNLKPRPLAGFKSAGMVLCAATPDKSSVAILEPPEGAVPGERVTVAGHEGEAAAPQRMAKKKILEAAMPDLIVDDGLTATYKGIPLMTSAGPVKISNQIFAGAQIA
ncbi:hypothetical protein FNF27_07215 [Cafeteria roenbergensis]|uniref:tRNA-binding domain-containing protein n=2 Tax=Cafeteria roenbergensis TaxID=33653 RepID=A0A5A8DRQ4_CAFRO|nr:hypothetical protein FNF27_07215 [Cafeteria roenbergensis]